VTDEEQKEQASPALTDEDRLRGLAHMDVLVELCDRARAARIGQVRSEPRTAAERHARDHGHLLRYGCCATVARMPARAT
jgi:hypothetical protein